MAWRAGSDCSSSSSLELSMWPGAWPGAWPDRKGEEEEEEEEEEEGDPPYPTRPCLPLDLHTPKRGKEWGGGEMLEDDCDT